MAKSPRSRSGVSLTPLIDVVFILLIFFMLVSNLQSTSRIDLHAAADSSAPVEDPDKPWLVTINLDTIELDGQPISLAQLREQVTMEPQRQVVLDPLQGVSLQRTVHILDQLRGAGSRQVSLLSRGTEK